METEQERDESAAVASPAARLQESDYALDLPEFIPPEAVRLEGPAVADAPAPAEPRAQDAVNDPAADADKEEPIQAQGGDNPPPADADKDRQQAAEHDPEAEADDDLVRIDQATLRALLEAASKVTARPAPDFLNPAEIERVNAAMQHGAAMPVIGPAQGQTAVKGGGQAFVEGAASLLGGAAALAGAVMGAVGKGAAALASQRTDPRAAPAGSDSQTDLGDVMVLPRLSDYRIEQTERAAHAYEQAQAALWRCDRLSMIRQRIEERALKAGLSVTGVMEKMKPKDQFAVLHEEFNAAVAGSPDAQRHKKAMDKALDSWVRQYERAQKELLDPERDGGSHQNALKQRLDASLGQMRRNTALTPAFEGESASHAEKLREAVQRIVKKLAAFVRSLVSAGRGRTAEVEVDVADGPSP